MPKSHTPFLLKKKSVQNRNELPTLCIFYASSLKNIRPFYENRSFFKEQNLSDTPDELTAIIPISNLKFSRLNLNTYFKASFSHHIEN